MASSNRIPVFSFFSWAIIGLVVAVSLLLAACEGEWGDDADDRFRVVATTSILADLVQEVGGDRVNVTGLMGPGVDPHLYRASEGDVARMARADLILYNGLQLEGRMTEVFGRMRQQGRATVAVAEESVAEDQRIASPEFGGSYDPHIWFDVQLWTQAARHVGEVLSEMNPEDGDYFRERAEAYVSELDELQDYVTQETRRVPDGQRVLVTSHDAFGYFGRAYDFEVHGLQGLSTEAEAGTADVQELTRLILDRRIPAIFLETSVSPRGIEAVREAARARGFEVVLGGTLYGDALGDRGTVEGTYVGAMRHNVDTIVAGLLREV